MQDVTFNTPSGLVIRGSRWGNDSAPPVLLGHGGGQTRHAWRQTAELLSEAGWLAIAIDLRGHGDSDWAADGAYQIEAFADDLIAIAGQLPSRPAVVGASLSGLAALIAEGEVTPGSFRSLTLVDITPRMDPVGVMKVLGFMHAHLEDGFASVDEAAEAVAAYLPHRDRRRSSEGLRRSLRRWPDGRYRWHWDPNFIRNIVTTREERRFERLEEAAARLRLPVQLIRGRMSELVTPEAAEAFLQVVPHARFDDISGAGHMVAGDRNDAFTGAVREFLEGLEGEGNA
ncbi:MAG: alpha/beta hydrolase [Pseudomonadales bacterium]|nr:alpha/beta hydrolase [Pseudomonadales bacterium]